VEASRRHGSFDARWPCVRKDTNAAPGAALGAAEVAEALDWDDFSARHFGDRGRHDAQARSAYAAYRQGREWREIGTAGLSLVPEPALAEGAEAPEHAGARRLLAAMAEVDPASVHTIQHDQR
jgi:hypothetical protein